MERLKKKINSISFRLPLLIVTGSMIMFFIIAQIAYARFDAQMFREYRKIAIGMSATISKNYDVEMQNEYLNKRYKFEQYRHFNNYLLDLKNSYSDIDKISIYKCSLDGMTVIFCPDEKPDNTIRKYDYGKDFEDKIYTIMTGREVVELTTVNNNGENVYLVISPIFDREGNCVASVEVRFSIDAMRQDNVRFILSVMALTLIIMSVIWSITMIDINRKMLAPMRKMFNCINSFTYDTLDIRYRNLEQYENLNINTGNELEMFYKLSLNVAKQNLFHLTKYTKAAQQAKDARNTAYRDELTRVGSKTAYAEKVQLLNEQIAQYKARFAIVMVDINNLKEVNDTLGHNKGDEYIKGCSDIICAIFAHSPVFRIGGDEFVVILENQDYDNRVKLVEKIIDIYEIMYSQKDKPLYERYSASIGYSCFTEKDTTYEKVFVRADKSMYENKAAFKRVNGSYR